jgi:hypothetical protein
MHSYWTYILASKPRCPALRLSRRSSPAARWILATLGTSPRQASARMTPESVVRAGAA